MSRQTFIIGFFYITLFFAESNKNRSICNEPIQHLNDRCPGHINYVRSPFFQARSDHVSSLKPSNHRRQHLHKREPHHICNALCAVLGDGVKLVCETPNPVEGRVTNTVPNPLCQDLNTTSVFGASSVDEPISLSFQLGHMAFIYFLKVLKLLSPLFESLNNKIASK